MCVRVCKGLCVRVYMCVFVDTGILTQHCILSSTNNKHPTGHLSTFCLSLLTRRGRVLDHWMGTQRVLSHLLEVIQGSLVLGSGEHYSRAHLSLFCPPPAGVGCRSTWRAAETEKPTRPALR